MTWGDFWKQLEDQARKETNAKLGAYGYQLTEGSGVGGWAAVRSDGTSIAPILCADPEALIAAVRERYMSAEVEP